MVKKDIPPKNETHVFNAIREKHIVEFPSILRVCNNEIRIIFLQVKLLNPLTYLDPLKNRTRSTNQKVPWKLAIFSE